MEKEQQQKNMLKTYTIYIQCMAGSPECCNTITGEDTIGGGAVVKQRYFTMFFLFYFLSPSNFMENIYI